MRETAEKIVYILHSTPARSGVGLSRGGDYNVTHCGRIKSNILQISKQLSTPKYIVIEGFSFFITADLNDKSVSFEFSANTIGLFSL